MPKLYRVTFNGQYLFHVMGEDEDDAVSEARTIAARSMRTEVVHGLTVRPEH